MFQTEMRVINVQGPIYVYVYLRMYTRIYNIYALRYDLLPIGFVDLLSFWWNFEKVYRRFRCLLLNLSFFVTFLSFLTNDFDVYDARPFVRAEKYFSLQYISTYVCTMYDCANDNYIDIVVVWQRMF